MLRLVIQLTIAVLVVSLGTRLLRLARQSGGEPERWLGAFFCFAGAALALSPVGAQLGAHETLGRALLILGQGSTTLGLVCLVRFNWQLFRPDSKAARNFAIFCSVLDIGTFVGVAWIGIGTAMQSDFGHLFVFSRFLILSLIHI